MGDKSLMEEMLPMKISNWESIEYSEGLNCPKEECDNKSCSCHKTDFKPTLREIRGRVAEKKKSSKELSKAF